MRLQRTATVSALLFCTVLFRFCYGINNGVGRTPAMGWNSWNRFRCEIDEQLIKEVADVMVSSGLRDAGYKYVNIDDCWQWRRDASGSIVPDSRRFPSGMKALADYVHSKGLLFGLYSDTGEKTCEGYPGSWGHEQQDANTYASWGVDYLKYDFCYMENSQEPVEESYARMSRALNATGRPILFSLCSWGTGKPWLWGNKVGNSWRTDADLFAVWDSAAAARLKLPVMLKPVTRALEVVEPLSEYAGPGGFNDPDMLVVGLEGMSPFGVVQDCPDHIPGCAPGQFISRERWGVLGHAALLMLRVMELHDPRTVGLTDELKLQVSQLSADLTHAHTQLAMLTSKIQQTEGVAEQLAAASAQQAARAQQHRLLEQNGGQQEGSSVGNREQKMVNGEVVWDEARMGAAVWSTWPGMLLLACNAAMLVVLLTSQFKRPRVGPKPESHSR
ncbi:glycoside hydrolase superfamily [Dunaliella salina]|uniref:Alpha-galactosidase n=1 Tax=Dunaliella salina TaxID=3046 RepID=A0ABQ7G1C4_DUNSA|nr:glycoside hydrolase superfamily [Dunaliella salina]|eukprot:KAF5828409.1 glycoside hydrolase superfamily [Dunaliella salina]